MTTIWIDAHLSPAIATWITGRFGITAIALRDIGLRDAEDPEIFEAAKAQEVNLWQYIKCPFAGNSKLDFA